MSTPTLLKWLKAVTKGLFVTLNPPVFLIVHKTKNQDYVLAFCNLLTTLGANVVSLNDLKSPKRIYQDLCDGLFDVRQSNEEIEVCFCRTLANGNIKRIKKVFALNAFIFA